MEAMERLRTRFLNIPLKSVQHPASASAQQAAIEQKVAAEAAPEVREEELTAQQWAERGFAATDPDDENRFYTEAIRLQPNWPVVLYNRGHARHTQGDLNGAIQDYGQAIQLNSVYADAFYNRGVVRNEKGDLDGALLDYNEAIRIQPELAYAYFNRAEIWDKKGHFTAAIADFQRYLDLCGEERHSLTEQAEQMIAELKKKL
jgi:tetratricopeptide (TPR) repeat protein